MAAQVEARLLQQQLLPRLASTAQVQVESLSRPSGTELLASGDFIDVVPFASAGAGAVAFCVGDVSGHDAASAGLAAELRAAWRTLALAGGDPVAWLASLDRLVAHEADDETFATACVGVVDAGSRRLLLASAGHPAPIVIGSSTAPVEVTPGHRLDWLSTSSRHGARRWLRWTGCFPSSCTPTGWWRDGARPGRLSATASSPSPPGSRVRPRRIIGSAGRTSSGWLQDVEAANGGPMVDDVSVVVLTGSSGAGQPPTPPVGQRRGGIASRSA